MLAGLGTERDLAREGYVFEPKLDGTRAICYKNSELMFINRRNRDITDRYPEFDFLQNIRAEGCVLDGEIVVYDQKGNPDFRLLQRREHAAPHRRASESKRWPATYVVFDILECNGDLMMQRPLIERKRLLEAMVTDGANIQKIVYTRDGKRLWEIVNKRKLEGVIAKAESSVYEEGHRDIHWLKIKTTATIECVIVGFTSEKRPVSAVALGLYVRGQLKYIGRAAAGLTEEVIYELRETLEPLRVDEPTAIDPPSTEVFWVRPELVCEVKFLEFTPRLHLRAPVFLRLREDKTPAECTLESQVGQNILRMAGIEAATNRAIHARAVGTAP
jgi:DNA ligase D-like protein (predicted ligase)